MLLPQHLPSAFLRQRNNIRNAFLWQRTFTTTTTVNPKGFGSFHSEDVEILINKSTSTYLPPLLPFNFDKEQRSFQQLVRDASFAMGTPACLGLFHLDPKWIFLNHGAFGASLKLGSELAQRWRVFAEEQPLRYFDRLLFPHLVFAHRSLAEFIDADARDVLIVSNATAGLNSILRSIPMENGDTVLMFNTAYGSVKTLVQHVCEKAGANVDLMQMEFPIESEEELEEVLLRKLSKGEMRYKYLVVDHISSNTAVKFPVEKLARLCERYGVRVIVDGAHGLLSEPLDMAEMKRAGVMYYVSNCHKWLCAPKGAAFIWQNPEATDHELLPPLVSHGFHNGLLSSFIWQGCNDYASALTLPYLFKAWEAVGVEKARQYASQQLWNGIDLLLDAWDITNSNRICSKDLHSGNMALVELPKHLQLGEAWADPIQNALHYRYNVEVPVKVVLSSHIYTNEEDFEVLARVVQELQPSDLG